MKYLVVVRSSWPEFMTSNLSACFHREEEEVVQSGWSSWGPAEPQARPCRVPAQTQKQLLYHPQLCVQPNERQYSRPPCDGQQHTSLCCLFTRLRSRQQIIPHWQQAVLFPQGHCCVRKTLQTYSQPLNMYSADCLKVFNELQECPCFSWIFSLDFFLIYIHNTNVRLDSKHVCSVLL